VSDSAIRIASENADLLGANNVRLFRSDWFRSLPETRYHAILTNPPYIHPAEAAGLDPEVREHDPGIALFHDNPHVLYAELFREASRKIDSSGFMIAEIAPWWATAVLDAARETFGHASIRRDYSGFDRFVIATFQSESK